MLTCFRRKLAARLMKKLAERLRKNLTARPKKRQTAIHKKKQTTQCKPSTMKCGENGMRRDVQSIFLRPTNFYYLASDRKIEVQSFSYKTNCRPYST